MGREIDPSILRCPACLSTSISLFPNMVSCGACGKEYSRTGAAIHFIEKPLESNPIGIDVLKSRLKRFDRLYNALIYLISPVYPDGHMKQFVRQYCVDTSAIFLNLGSGSSLIAETVTNIDLFAYPNVDITADVNNLPIRDHSVDIIISVALLEHVASPKSVVAEIKRILKNDGIVYAFFPFIQGFHSAPGDYSRCTDEGLRTLFHDFNIIESRVTGGPTSGLLWILQEWLAMVLSLGIRPLYTILHVLIMGLTFPLKFIDIILRFHPMAKNIASGFTVIARKP